MNRYVCSAALSLAVALTGATAAVAAHKHHAAQVTAPQRVSAQVADPRKMVGANHATWCDASAACNGWDKWLDLVKEGKLKPLGTQ